MYLAVDVQSPYDDVARNHLADAHVTGNACTVPCLPKCLNAHEARLNWLIWTTS